MANNTQTIFEVLVDVLGKEKVDQLTESLGGAGVAGGKAAPELQAFVDKLQELADRSQLVSKAIDLQQRVEANNAALAQARIGLEGLNAEFSRTDKSSVAVSTAFAQAQKQVSALAAEQLKLQNESAGLSDKLRLAGIDSTKLGEEQAGLKTQTKAVGDEMLRAAESARVHAERVAAVKETVAKASESLKAGAERVLEFGKKLLEITGIAGLVTGALATISGFRFFEEGAKDALNMDEALAKLSAISGKTGEELSHLKEASEEAAHASSNSAVEAVNALAKLAQQLGDTDKAAQALPATMQLAHAASLDLGVAIDVVTTTLKAFNVNADETRHVTDILATLSLKTGANLGALAENFGKVAPVAAQVGSNLEDTAAALGGLVQKGLSAEQASRALIAVFNALNDPSNKFRQDLVGLGIDTSSFATVLDGLKKAGDRGVEALDGLDKKSRPAILALAREGSASLQAMTRELQNSAGATESLSEKMTKHLKDALHDFGTHVEELAGEAVSGGIQPIEEEIRKLDEELLKVSKTEAFEKIKESIKLFVADAVQAFDKFVHSVDWENLGKTIANFAKSASDSLKALGENASTVGKVFGGIADIVSAAWNVIKVVFDSIAAATSHLASFMVESMAGALDKLGAVSDAAAAKAKEFHDLAKQYSENAKEFWDAGDQAAGKVAASLGNLADKILGAGDAAKGAAPEHKKHAESLEQTAAAAAKIPSDLDNAIRALAALNAAGTTSGVAVDALKNLIAQLRGEVQKLPSALDQAKENLNNAVTALGVLEQAGITTGPAVDALSIQIQSLSARLRDVNAPANNAAVNLKTMEAAAAGLGITLQRDLRDSLTAAANEFQDLQRGMNAGLVTITDVQNGFVAYAEKRLAAASKMDQATRESVQRDIEAKLSTMNLTDADKAHVKELLAASEALDGLSISTRGASQVMGDSEKQTEKFDSAIKTLRDDASSLADKMKAVAIAMETASTATQKQAAAAESVETNMRAAMGAGQSLGQVMAGTASQFTSVSEAAGKEFTAALDHAMSAIGLTKVAATDLTNQMNDLSAAAADTTGFVSYFRALAAVAQETQAKIDGQRDGLRASIATLDTYGTAAQKNFGVAARGADALLNSLLAQRKALDDGNSGFDLLGQQELGPLQQALDSAISRTQALVNAAQAAKNQFDSLAQSVNDALLQEQGNQTALEDERHQRQLKDLLDAAKAADALNSDTYQKAVQQENQLHDLKMKNLAAQEAAAKKSSASSSTAGSSSSSSASSPALPPSPAPAPAPGGVVNHNTFNMEFYGANSNDFGDFVRNINKELKRIGALSK